jgi:hypothetical protein
MKKIFVSIALIISCKCQHIFQKNGGIKIHNYVD